MIGVQVCLAGQMRNNFDGQMLSPLDHAVLPESFNRDAFSESLVTTSNTATGSSLFDNIQQPFVAAHKSFETLFCPDASIKFLAKKDYAFAHEAGVYSSRDNKVWFTSNLLIKDGKKSVEISRVSLETGEVEIVEVDRVRLGNGGHKYREGIIFCDQGTSKTPSQLVYCSFDDPSNARSILNNFNGRQFNSLNDVVVLEHPSGDLICFTDPPYGHEQGFRPACQLPPAVYAFDPKEGHVRMLADGFHHPNGIAFSPDGTTCYVTDTSHIHGSGRLDPSSPSTM
jgi:gluconolactonase